jgi:hypothetical protein
MGRLLYYTPSYIAAFERFMEAFPDNFSNDFREHWIYKKKRHDSLRLRIGLRGNAPQVIDREEKYHFLFNTKAHTIIPPMVYKQGLKPLEDLLIDRAMELKSTGLPIQLFWSGGVDSTSSLFALYEVCRDQLMVQTTPDAVQESQLIYDKYVKHVEHNIHTGNNLLSVADPSKYIVSTACEADSLYNTNVRGRLNEKNCNPKRFWYMRNRFTRTHKTFRWYLKTEASFINTSNLKSFYDCDYIEQYFINRILDGSLTYTDKSDKGYTNHKLELRNFLSKFEPEFGKNKLGRMDIRHSDANLMKAVQFNSKQSKVTPDWNIMAITESGDIFKRENKHIKHDISQWSPEQYWKYGERVFLPFMSSWPN